VELPRAGSGWQRQNHPHLRRGGRFCFSSAHWLRL